jgi:tetratricopeptide (TPR) repeat protein
LSDRDKTNAFEIDLLIRAVESGEFHFIVVRQNHLSWIGEVENVLRDRFPDRPLSRVKLPLSSEDSISKRVVAQGSGFILIDNFEKILEDDSVRVGFNQRRDLVSGYPVSLIVFIADSAEVARGLQKGIPDFWSIRGLELELLRELETSRGMEMLADEPWIGGSNSKKEKQAEIRRLRKRFKELEGDISSKAYLADLANQIGTLLYSLGENKKAMKWFELAKDLFIEFGDRKGEGFALNNLGQIYISLEDYDSALSYFEKDLKICQEASDREGERISMNNIGQTYIAKGEYDIALDYLEQSLKISQEIEVSDGWATLNNIGLIYHAKQDPDTALHYYELSLKISQEIGDREGEGIILANISQIQVAKGDYEIALHYLNQSLKISQEIGDVKIEAISSHNIGAVFVRQQELEKATPFLVKACKLAKKLGKSSSDSKKLLNVIKSSLGEVRYQEIISQISAI